ncbi:MAG: LPS export ABC transporter permease LptG [Pseudomonadota bacterium]
MSATLSRYLALRLVASVGGLFIAFTLLIMLIDLIENLRFAGKYADGSVVFALKITAMRALSLTQVLSPFLFLFGGLWCFNQLNRRSEIAVMRAAGLSIWRVLLPPAFTAGVIGAILIIVIDPLSARMMASSEALQNEAQGRRTSLVQFFQDGVWLRQRDAKERLMINAKAIDQEKGILRSVTIHRFDADSVFLERIDAPLARLQNGTLEMTDASLRMPTEPVARKVRSFTLTTKLTAKDLTEQVAKPETISVWQLNRFIGLAEAAGLPTRQYYLRYHDLLSTPLKLLGMVLIAAAFSIQPTRLGGTLTLVLGAIGTGFALYVVTELATALGESGNVPIALAAWTPSIVATLMAVTGLLHLEDG